MLKEVSFAATDVEDTHAGRNQRGNGSQIRPQAVRCHPTPARAATEPRNALMVAKSSGSSRRKASCPRSVSISTKLTLAAAAFKAWAMRLFSAVGKSQSLVKEMMQKCVFEPRKASAREPP